MLALALVLPLESGELAWLSRAFVLCHHYHCLVLYYGLHVLVLVSWFVFHLEREKGQTVAIPHGSVSESIAISIDP